MQHHGKWPEAEKASRKALEVLDRVATDGGGAFLQQRAGYLVGLAACLTYQGKDREAEELYREAHSISDATLGPSHPNTVATLFRLATLLQKTGRCVPLDPTPQPPLLHLMNAFSTGSTMPPRSSDASSASRRSTRT